MARGTVKQVVSDRGFGFIAGEDGRDYVFHRDGLASSLDIEGVNAGEQVEFDLQSSERGSRAVNVRRADGHGDPGEPVGLGSPRWGDVVEPKQGDVERGHRFRNDPSPTERGAIDRDDSVGSDSNRPAVDPGARSET